MMGIAKITLNMEVARATNLQFFCIELLHPLITIFVILKTYYTSLGEGIGVPYFAVIFSWITTQSILDSKI